MTLRTPPSWLQYGSHTAENDRLTQQATYSTTGVIGNSMAVSPYLLLQVQVASGWCAIVSSYSNGGAYVGYNDDAVTLTVSTPDVTNPRIDLVVATVNDQAYAGVTNNITYQIITGTPAASPVAPSTPTNSIALAQIAVAANATSISAANITDRRVHALSTIGQNNSQHVRLSAAGSAVSATGDIFGASNGIKLAAGHLYNVRVTLPFIKTTTGAVAWVLQTDAGTSFTGYMTLLDSLNQATHAFTASPTAALSITSAAYTTATTYVTELNAVIKANTDAYLACILGGTTVGTVTPQLGSLILVEDLGTNDIDALVG